MKLRLAFPDSNDSRELDEPGADAWLAERYQLKMPNWLRLNLVTSLNGSAVGADGTSQSLTSPTDRRILGAIRRASDVILVGAATVRHEVALQPKTVPLAVVTASGDLSGHRFGTTGRPPGALILLCPPSAFVRLDATLGDVPHLRLPLLEPGPEGIVARLRAQGFLRITCEGGPSLAGELLAAGLVDELCLTTSPVFVSPGLPFRGGSASVRGALTQLLIDETGAGYARWSMAV